ncbi:reverse gyrase [Thioflavicoccus mobilis 8321]|uniref:Reverse gyrase n=1 Tax=Thioflavicoccus mobilis 8321 TaxID=765912 RepID=L0H1U9_9GAMM|nr:YfdX family protein [Thioflavicoccus mobilis]AGA92216.1 reverse gyrase [Thioflavicoccus mobilis 8321]
MTMKPLLLATSISVLSAGLAGYSMTPAFAYTPPTPPEGGAPASASVKAPASAAEPAAEKKSAEDLIKVCDDALLTMRYVTSARLAIFNGLPEKARTFADAARARADAAVKDADAYVLDAKEPKAEDMYVPFDAGLVVAEDFTVTPEKMKHITKANKHLHKGETQAALDALKQGAVDVAVTTKLIPVKFAQVHVDDATKLLEEGKYYEANLALKAVEDAMVIESYKIGDVPQRKAKS